jgi:hypothetical protein
MVTEWLDHTRQPLGSMALPPFHMFGIFCHFLLPLTGVCSAVFPPTATLPGALPIVPSPDNILDHARKTKCRALMTVPALLVSWSTSPPAVAYLKTLHTVVSLYIPFLLRFR